jgi:hypothetical protein
MCDHHDIPILILEYARILNFFHLRREPLDLLVSSASLPRRPLATGFIAVFLEVLCPPLLLSFTPMIPTRLPTSPALLPLLPSSDGLSVHTPIHLGSQCYVVFVGAALLTSKLAGFVAVFLPLSSLLLCVV